MIIPCIIINFNLEDKFQYDFPRKWEVFMEGKKIGRKEEGKGEKERDFIPVLRGNVTSFFRTL